MMRKSSTNGARGAITCIVVLLIFSGMLRLGMVGFAVARETVDTPQSIASHAQKTCEPGDDLSGLLELIQKRTSELDQMELALLDRAQALRVAEQVIEQNMTHLVEAERKLAATIAQVDSASENDLDRLTAVYETMKPKMASALFEQMSPEFAAGFLGRMSPSAAAEIMSGLPSDAAYAVSVVLAGRNANAPKQ